MKRGGEKSNQFDWAGRNNMRDVTGRDGVVERIFADLTRKDAGGGLGVAGVGVILRGNAAARNARCVLSRFGPTKNKAGKWKSYIGRHTPGEGKGEGGR